MWSLENPLLRRARGAFNCFGALGQPLTSTLTIGKLARASVPLAIPAEGKLPLPKQLSLIGELSKLGRGEGNELPQVCLLYTSDAADERSSVDLGGRRIIKK